VWEVELDGGDWAPYPFAASSVLTSAYLDQKSAVDLTLRGKTYTVVLRREFKQCVRGTKHGRSVRGKRGSKWLKPLPSRDAGGAKERVRKSGGAFAIKSVPPPQAGHKHSIVSLTVDRLIDPDPARDFHFRMAESQLFRMYAQAGAPMPGKVVKVDVIVNTSLQRKYESKKTAMKTRANEIFAFHGGKEDNYTKIASNNFDIAHLSKGSGNQGR
jgi:hypothetical protein